ncbi:hypothetical protein ACFQO7_26540 [Catellatospora aurea]|uniref:Uncharacterized protein n=1 Tax=Catellatospora aurea TaxID=1337874 RepID=A0ABW2H5Z5_9ACTN
MSALTEVGLDLGGFARPRVPVMGEQAAPGLLIVPAVNAEYRYSGGWWLVHAESGRVLTAVPTCVHCARTGAGLLAGHDWTRPVLVLTADPAVQATVTGARFVALVRGCASAYTCEIPEGC